MWASSASRLSIPHSAAMSRAKPATAALWRAVRLSRRSSERTSADRTPHDSEAYCPVRSRATTTRRLMYEKAMMMRITNAPAPGPALA